MPRIDPRKVPTLYVIAMAAWIYGFAAADRSLPALVVFVLLLMGAAVQVWVGFEIGRWEAIGLAVVPVLLAVAAAGIDSSLWTTHRHPHGLPGRPAHRPRRVPAHLDEERNDRSPDSWLYGEEPATWS